MLSIDNKFEEADVVQETQVDETPGISSIDWPPFSNVSRNFMSHSKMSC